MVIVLAISTSEFFCEVLVFESAVTMEEFAKILTESIKGLRDASARPSILTNFEVPLFEPDRDDDGAAKWCDEMEKLGETFNWTSHELLVRSAAGLVGEAKEWFYMWKPSEKSWEEFRNELSSLYPAKRNLSEKLRKASQYTSKEAKSYCEYARKKYFLLIR